MKKLMKKILLIQGYKLIKVNKSKDLKDEIEEFLGFSVSLEQLKYLEKGFDYLKEIKEKNNAIFEYENDEFIVIIENCRFLINTWEELLILYEVYVKGIYNFNYNKNFILVDIGMNVGITSLFFANKIECVKIYSFEPFLKTFDLAKSNFENNEISNKIIPYNFGLGFPERNLIIDYNEEYKGSIGINGLSTFDSKGLKFSKQNLEIKDVAKNIIEIINSHTLDIILKIDCEGAEYEIIERLSNENILEKISFLMIEWLYCSSYAAFRSWFRFAIPTGFC